MQPRKAHRINMGLVTVMSHAPDVTGLVPKQEIGNQNIMMFKLLAQFIT